MTPSIVVFVIRRMAVATGSSFSFPSITINDFLTSKASEYCYASVYCYAGKYCDANVLTSYETEMHIWKYG